MELTVDCRSGQYWPNRDSAVAEALVAMGEWQASGIEVLDWGAREVEGYGWTPILTFVATGERGELSEMDRIRIAAAQQARAARATARIIQFPTPAKKSYTAYWVLGGVAAITLAIVAATVAAKK